MPEKICFPHQLGGESADIDHIVPSLGEMEFDEICLTQMMDQDLAKADTSRLYHIQDAVFCEPLPMSPALGMQIDSQKYRSHSTGGDLYAEHHLPYSTDDTQSSFLQDLMQTGSMTDIHGTIPIYNQSLNSSGLTNTPTGNNSPSTSKACHTPQLQDTADSFSSLVFAFPQDLSNIDSLTSCCINNFPSQAVASTGNSVITEDWDAYWEQLYITAPTNVDNTVPFKVPAVPSINNLTAHTYPTRQQIGRMKSCPHISYNEKKADIEEPVAFSCSQIYSPCSTPMNQRQTSTLLQEGSAKAGKKSHRRTSSDTNLIKFFGDNQMVYGAHNAQLVPNETFSMPTFPEQTQHQQHSSHPPNKQPTKRVSFKRRHKNTTHPYPHCFHTPQVNMNIDSSHAAVVHETSLHYPATTTYKTNSPRVVQSQSVPSSPSIHRAAESSPSTISLPQQLCGHRRSTAPAGNSNFPFDVLPTAVPTHISPICDINTGTSQEARDEKEKTEAFSRLHQGLHLWEFLMEILLTNEYQPILKWTDKENGVFKIVDSEALARFWGEYRRKPKMNYDKMSRAIRYYYGKDILDKAPKRLYYQFKYHSHWWEKLQKADASFKINHIPVSDIPAPSVQDLIIPDEL